jgi:hypothetical protein
MTQLRASALALLRNDGLLVAVLIGLDVVARLLPHLPNFTPVAATTLFAAVVLRRRALALLIPLIAMPVSDALIGFDDWRITAIIYASMALPFVAGLLASRYRLSWSVAPAMLASSLLFYAISNFAVWAFSGMYSHDLAGLIQCYVLALPFLKTTVACDLLWAGGLFGAAHLVQRLASQRQAVIAATN